MTGCDGVFATGTFHRVGPAGELRHGIAVGEATRDAAVGHLVYVSGAGAAPATGVPILEVKSHVEARLRALDLPCTVIAPVYLMENLFNPASEIRAARTRPRRALPMARARRPEVDVNALRHGYPEIRWHRFEEWARAEFVGRPCVTAGTT